MGRILPAVLAVAVVLVPVTVASPAHAEAAAAPGTTSHFDLARKDCVGTAHQRGSKVWFTVADGVLSDVYSPTIDNTNVESMRYIATDGRTFTELQGQDTAYTAQTDKTGMVCTVTTSSKAGRYRLVTTFITDPARDAVVVSTRLESRQRLDLYVRLDASVNGNGGGGPVNGGADSGVVRDGVPVVSDENTVTSAANRDYAVPTHLALAADRRLPQASVGYAGTPSDGASMLDEDRAIRPATSAPPPNCSPR